MKHPHTDNTNEPLKFFIYFGGAIAIIFAIFAALIATWNEFGPKPAPRNDGEILSREARERSSSVIESISIDFPHGETRLVVWNDGQASLFYGALPQSGTIRTGVFDVAELHQQLKHRLHPNTPSEDWPNPESIAGMVQVSMQGKGETTYLIFDEQAFTETLFDKARKHVVDKER